MTSPAALSNHMHDNCYCSCRPMTLQQTRRIVRLNAPSPTRGKPAIPPQRLDTTQTKKDPPIKNKNSHVRRNPKRWHTTHIRNETAPITPRFQEYPHNSQPPSSSRRNRSSHLPNKKKRNSKVHGRGYTKITPVTAKPSTRADNAHFCRGQLPRLLRRHRGLHDHTPLLYRLFPSHRRPRHRNCIPPGRPVVEAVSCHHGLTLGSERPLGRWRRFAGAPFTLPLFQEAAAEGCRVACCGVLRACPGCCRCLSRLDCRVGDDHLQHATVVQYSINININSVTLLHCCRGTVASSAF